MGHRRLAVACAIAAGTLASVACGSLLGGDQDDAPPNASVADAADEEAAAVTVSSDASQIPVDEGGCHPPGIVDNGSRTLYGYRSTTAKTLDGVLDDFSVTCPTYVLTRATTAYIFESDGGFGDPTAKVYVEWEPDTLWIGVDVSGLTPSEHDAGTNDDADADASAPLEPRNNDSVEVYVSAKPDERDSDGLKTQWERQYILDFLGNALQYIGAENVPTSFPDSRAIARSNGYTIEMRIGSDVFLPFTLGRKLGFDVLLNVGTFQRNFGFLALQPHAVCGYSCPDGSFCSCNYPSGSGGDTPAFDTLLYAPLTLR